MRHTPLLLQPDSTEVSKEKALPDRSIPWHASAYLPQLGATSSPIMAGRLPPAPVTSWPAVASGVSTAPHAHALTPHRGQGSTHSASLRPPGHGHLHGC